MAIDGMCESDRMIVGWQHCPSHEACRLPTATQFAT